MDELPEVFPVHAHPFPEGFDIDPLSHYRLFTASTPRLVNHASPERPEPLSGLLCAPQEPSLHTRRLQRSPSDRTGRRAGRKATA